MNRADAFLDCADVFLKRANLFLDCANLFLERVRLFFDCSKLFLDDAEVFFDRAKSFLDSADGKLNDEICAKIKSIERIQAQLSIIHYSLFTDFQQKTDK